MWRKETRFEGLFGRQSALQPVAAGLATDSAPPGMTAVLMSSSGGNKKRTVQGQRRRPSGSSSSGSRERAEAPRRDSRPSSSPPAQRPPGGGYVPPSGGGYTPSSGLPGGGFQLPRGGCTTYLLLGVGLVVLLVLAVIFFGLGGGDSDSLSQSGGIAPQGSGELFGGVAPEQQPEQSQVESSFQGSGQELPAGATSPDQTWTVMLYQDADDKVLEQDILIDLNEAERVGSSDRVNIVAQLDRYAGGYSGDGNWTEARRFYLQQDNDLNSVRSPYESVGEVNMGDPANLVDFATWAIENYPADKYVLIMSDHGMGWPGGWTDNQPRANVPSGIPLAQRIGQAMYLMDIDNALQEIRDRTGVEALEIVGMDACLMGHVEVFSALAPHARYAVASQEVEPAVGWAYTAFLGELVNNPDMPAIELSQHIVRTYIDQDQRVTDPAARAEFTSRGPFGTPSASQLANQLQQSITLSAADLSAMPEVLDSLNNFAFALQGANQRDIAQARTYAQPFTSIFGSSVPPSYIDLAHFAAILAQESGDANVRTASEQLLASINQLVVANKIGPKKPGATGLSVYFPNSNLYGNPAAGPQSYIPVAERFAQSSTWDDFLAFHYTGRNFSADAEELVLPDAPVTAPGASDLRVSDVTLSDDVAAPGNPVVMSADVEGANIGYIYFFAGFYDRAANSIYVADTDYIDSGETREVDGVYYPDWGEGEFTLEFTWEPIVFAINDGVASVQALLQPKTYGVSPEEAVYAVNGRYTYQDGETREAQMLLSNGNLLQIVGFQGEGSSSGAPREIIPTAGDFFTVYETWYDLNAAGAVVNISQEDGDTITFGRGPVTWEILDGPAGDYTIGYIVEDMDGNRVETFTDITVE